MYKMVCYVLQVVLSLISHAPSVSSSVLICYVRTLSSLDFTQMGIYIIKCQILSYFTKIHLPRKRSHPVFLGLLASSWAGMLVVRREAEWGASSFSLLSPPLMLPTVCLPPMSLLLCQVPAGWTWGSSADRKSSEISGRQWEGSRKLWVWRRAGPDRGCRREEPWHRQIRYWRRSRTKLVRSWLKYVMEMRASQKGSWGRKQESRAEEDVVMERGGNAHRVTWSRVVRGALEYHWGQATGGHWKLCRVWGPRKIPCEWEQCSEIAT